MAGGDGQIVCSTLCVVLLPLGHGIQERFQTSIPPEALPRLLLTHCSPHHHYQGPDACGCRRPGSPCASRSSSSRLCTACRHAFSHRDRGCCRVDCDVPAGAPYTGGRRAGSHAHGGVAGRAALRLNLRLSQTLQPAAGCARGATGPAGTQTLFVTDHGARQQALDRTPCSHTAQQQLRMPVVATHAMLQTCTVCNTVSGKQVCVHGDGMPPIKSSLVLHVQKGTRPWHAKLTSTDCRPPPSHTQSTCHASWPAAPAENRALTEISCCEAAPALQRNTANARQSAQQANIQKARQKVVTPPICWKVLHCNRCRQTARPPQADRSSAGAVSLPVQRKADSEPAAAAA